MTLQEKAVVLVITLLVLTLSTVVAGSYYISLQTKGNAGLVMKSAQDVSDNNRSYLLENGDYATSISDLMEDGIYLTSEPRLPKDAVFVEEGNIEENLIVITGLTDRVCEAVNDHAGYTTQPTSEVEIDRLYGCYNDAGTNTFVRK